jgi:phosphohistidine phosphatase
MPTLALLRHAKSDYPPGVTDHRRPLSERGRGDAVAAGPVLRRRVPRPELVLVSSATRAQQTWQAAEGAWESRPHHVTEPRIYEASVDDLLLVVRDSGAADSLVLVGHNPGLAEFAAVLSDGTGDRAALNDMARKFPTSGLAVFTVDRPLAHLVAGGGRLASFDIPRG